MPGLSLAMAAVVVVSGGGAAGRPQDAGAGSAAPSSPESVVQVAFDVALTPRIDPVFVDARGLRDLIEQFGSLDTEMQKTRDAFSTAVQQTLAVLPRATKGSPGACPEHARVTYAKALTAGARYLELGRKLELLFRQIRRADDQGETSGLTPDFRNKARLAREGFRTLLSDYRDMRVAFYEQLGAELRHVGCEPKLLARAAERSSSDGAADPVEAASWVLPEEGDTPSVRSEVTTESTQVAGAGGAPAIWITIDNGDCVSDTRVSLDEGPVSTVVGQKQLPLRTHAGPHRICVLPNDDPRACGAPGTLRKAYLHEGWTLALHCRKP